MNPAAWIGLLLVSPAMEPQEPEAKSLFGKPLFAAKLSLETQKIYEDHLAKARAAWEADPTSIDKYLWVGRRIAYLGQFKAAIDWFKSGLDRRFEGENVRIKLARHLGHRYISVRLFDEADAIFGKYEDGLASGKDEIEPDGLPNARNIPIGTVHSNFLYHQGLAKYLKGDFAGALKVCESDLHPNVATPSQAGGGGVADRLVSTAYWQALCYAKLGRKDLLDRLLSSISKNLDVIENQSYHRLLLFFKGELPEKELLENAKTGNDRPTVGYGVAAWRLHQGRREEAVALLRDILKGEAVFAFGYIAAEAELKRLHLKPQ